MDTQRLHFVTDDGVKLAYAAWPGPTDAPPIVLHHGFTGDADRELG